jgi:hypothetical protein
MVGLPPPLNLFTIAHSPVKFQVSSFQFQVREARVDLAFRPASKLLLSLLTTNNWPLTTVVCHPVYNDVGVVKRHGSLAGWKRSHGRRAAAFIADPCRRFRPTVIEPGTKLRALFFELRSTEDFSLSGWI